MVTATDRRQFMQQGAATLILGFPFLSEATGAATAELLPFPRLVYSGLLGRAIKRIADECKPAIVLLIRPDHSNAQLIAELDRDLLFDTSADARRLFAQAIFVCVPIAEALAAFPLKDDTIAVLLDHKGCSIDELKQEPWPFENAAVQLTRFLHGPGRKHLALTSSAQRQCSGRRVAGTSRCGLAKPVRRRLPRARNGDAQIARNGTPYLSDPGGSPFEWRRRNALSRIDLVFDRYYNRLPDTAGQRLPFGVEWFDEPFNPCSFCGQVAFSPQMRRTVKVLRWTQK